MTELDHNAIKKDVEAGITTIELETQPRRSRVESRFDDRDLSLQPVPAVDIAIRNVNVTLRDKLTFKSRFKRKSALDVTKNDKRILDDVSADFPSGSLTAILGSSGSGKTSLLNVLADRIHDGRLDIGGQLVFNDAEHQHGVEAAYVMQQDVLLPTLSVRETLQYSADLRLRDVPEQAERYKIVEEVILELSLKEAAETRVKYCSGGERRRTSLAIQLLANPSVLWLDEPTTGLDATSAYQLIYTLKLLAKKGRTVIVTIHQPRSEIWGLFDRVILLARGKPVYADTRQGCIGYFTDLGYALPPFCNPAEHVIDVAAIDTRSRPLELASTARVDDLIAAWAIVSEDRFGAKEVSGPKQSRKGARARNQAVPFTRQVRVLTLRVWTTTIRDPLGLVGSIFEAVFLGIVMGWIFLSLDGSIAGIRSRTGAAYIASALQGYLIMMYETYRLSADVQIYDRERAEGVVGVSAFMISRRIAKLIEDIPVPLIFSLLFYFMAGLRREGDTFMVFFIIVWLSHYIAIAFATCAVALNRDFAMAALIGNLSFTWQSFACGFFLLAENMPVYVRWARYSAYVCIPSNWIGRPIAILVGFAIGYSLLSVFLFALIKQEVKVGRAREDDTDKSAGKERMEPNRAEEVRSVTMRLQDYTIDVASRARQGLKMKSEDISILKSINTVFEPGKLNIIMGPSGSGKTSLLASMASRLQNDFVSRWRIGGKLLLNEAEPTKDVLQSIVSYVTQADDTLLAKLTVRETLRFAAGLRLPKHMSKAHKDRRAEEVLLQMGLKDCANSVVGSDLVKGISGGEKRRCTIAIQILTDPRVLLLDEPTSGLDGFTAASIMEVLKGLAQEGRTIILTIHQSRSDLWSSFGNVLLLARGGFPVYAGTREGMIDHFSKLGHECPATTNPADFALDLITIDLRRAEQETATREKLQGLIDGWNSTPQLFARRGSAIISTPAELGALRKTRTPFLTALPKLVHRSWLNLWRQPPLWIGRIMQIWGMSIIATFFFAPLKKDFYSIQTRLGFVQQVAPVYFVGMLNNIAIYPDEQAVFYREHDDRAYSVEAFLVQYTALELPFEVLISFLFATLLDIAAGLPITATAFYVVSFNVLCIVNCGESLGIVFNTLISHTGFAVQVMSVFLSIAQVMGGTIAIGMPSFLQAWNHLSPIKWSVQSLAHIAFDGIEFGCLENDGAQCVKIRGEDVRREYDLNLELWKACVALGAVTVGYRLIAYLVLKFMREKWYNVFRRLGRWKK